MKPQPAALRIYWKRPANRQGVRFTGLHSPSAGANAGPRDSTPQPKLLDRVREALEARRYSSKTIRRYVQWIRRFVIHHRMRHPDGLDEAEINDVKTTMVYTHVLNRGPSGVRSPMDDL